jgi:hypothetical protein
VVFSDSGEEVEADIAEFSVVPFGADHPAPANGVGFLTLEPDSIDFGEVALDSSSTASATLGNTGESSLQVAESTISGSGDVEVVSALPIVLEPGETAALEVSFTPTAEGPLDGALTLEHTDGNTPSIIELAGVGTATSAPTVTNVDLGATYGSLADAFAADGLAAGHTLQATGVFVEDVTISESVTVTGDATIVGAGAQNIVNVAAPGVTLEGVTIEGGEGSRIGVMVRTDDVTIEGVTVRGIAHPAGRSGIGVRAALDSAGTVSGLTVIDSTFEDLGDPTQDARGFGILLGDDGPGEVADTTITGNTFVDIAGRTEGAFEPVGSRRATGSWSSRSRRPARSPSVATTSPPWVEPR